ncbi:hypothetical protein [Xenorhabdus eapokensis]|uniref:Uncharacterized protein n=1 Tax=Xenorhabdus eapokensis TaxID=1873482 RepID=A0A1Q5TQT2_9GAMM|nr:hypothetical protein [Xenorhabdus eapokensis]OKP02588.1 hypothetical protein Xedl_02239 [Xenorhabdus eapokensis]
MPKHIHADLIMEYAKLAQVTDKPWEYFEVLNDNADGWSSFAGEFYFNVARKYRLKPRAIKIGDIEVPEPVRYTPSRGTEYFVPITTRGTLCGGCVWFGDEFDLMMLKTGQIHLDKESAELHAKALISLTQK